MGGVDNLVRGIATLIASVYLAGCSTTYQAPETLIPELPTPEIKVSSLPLEVMIEKEIAPEIVPEPIKENCFYDIEFVADINYPDGALIEPNVEFIKTWTIENTGDCDILDAELVYVSGAKMEGVAFPIENIVEGEQAEISVELTSP